MRINSRQLTCFLIIFFPLLWPNSVQARRIDRSISTAISLDILSPNYFINSYYWVPGAGGYSHFFSSRERYCIGYKLSLMGWVAPWERKGYGIGMLISLTAGKTRYWLNWQLPEIASLDPLDASLHIMGVEIGPLLCLRTWKFEAKPYFSIPLQLYRYKVKLLDDTYSSEAKVILGVNAGLVLSVDIKGVQIIGGIAGMKRFKDNHEFYLSHDKTLFAGMIGNMEGIAKEYYLGIGFPTVRYGARSK